MSRKIIIESPRAGNKVKVELYNCDIDYLQKVKKIICIHPANHSVSLFLKMKDNADLCLYCHPLLAKESSKEFVIKYVSKFKYPLVILTRMEDIEALFKRHGCPTKWRRWCSRVLKIEATMYFYKKFITSGVIEYMGMQKAQSKERSEMNPDLIEDAKSQKRYKIYRELPIFNETEEDNLKRMKEARIKPFSESVRSFHRYGCYLCPFAGEKYYEELKINDPQIYNRCNELMKLGSKDGSRYYYHRKSKIM